MNEVDGAKAEPDTAKDFVFAIENVVKDARLTQSGCEDSEDGLVMIDCGASVNVCPKWFGKSTLQKSDESVLLRGADGRTLQDYGKRQIWLKIGNNLKRYDFHVVEATKPILSVSYLCEHGIETHLAREQFLKCGNRREPLIKRNGVYFAKAACVRAGDSQNHAYEQEIHKIDEYEQEIHKIDEYEQEIHKSLEKSCVRAEDSQKWCVQHELKIHKSGADELKIHTSHAHKLKILKN